ncbi:hypothetical protein, partial [Nonomuraea lactucae]|uniref:hypothetical protein n=1 Tax=Nonomuraea lactucae TaxID=2249762 RepID=UPI0019651EB3
MRSVVSSAGSAGVRQDVLTTLPWGTAIRDEAAELAVALRLGEPSSAAGPVRWEVDSDAVAIRWSAGRVVIPAAVLDLVAAAGFPIPGVAGDGVEALALSLLIAVTALATPGKCGPAHGAWPIDGSGRPRLDGPDGAEGLDGGATARVAVLGAVLLAADDAAATVAETLRGHWPVPQIRSAARVTYIAGLAHPQPARRRQACRRTGEVVTSCWLLPGLRSAYRRTTSPAVRLAIDEAHHLIGKAALAAPDERAVSRIRRSTYSGRLHRLDRLIAQLVVSAADGGEPVAGVDVELLRRSLDEGGAVRIRDEAVSDGRTSVDLWHALRDAGVRGTVLAGDRYSAFTLVETPDGAAGVLDGSGRCIQIESTEVLELPAARRPGLGDPTARRLEVSPARTACRWVTPARPPLEQCAAAGLALEFRGQDVFVHDPRPAQIIRACGLLYRRLRDDVDADSYFADADIAAAISGFGDDLTVGGVLLVGSVIDSRDSRRRYTDVDVLQRTAGGELRHCARLGRGVGPAVAGGVA